MNCFSYFLMFGYRELVGFQCLHGSVCVCVCVCVHARGGKQMKHDVFIPTYVATVHSSCAMQ